MSFDEYQNEDGGYTIPVAVCYDPEDQSIAYDAPEIGWGIGFAHGSCDGATSTSKICTSLEVVGTMRLRKGFDAVVLSDDGVALPRSENVRLDAGRKYRVRLSR